MHFKKVLLTALAFVLAAPVFAQVKTLKIGTVSGPDAQIWEVAQRVAAKRGLKIKIIEFGDYVQPNSALAAGDLDANGMQTLPYLESMVKQRGYPLVSVGTTYITPMGVYSRQYRSLSDLPEGAKVAVPNDPSNEDRAFLLLQAQKIVTLRAGAGQNGHLASLLDVQSNPKKIKFIELDSAQLPRSLLDVDAAVINTNYALAAGLQPAKDAIALELPKNNPYVNVIAVRQADQNQAWVKELVAAYQSPEVKKFIEQQFKGSTLPAF